MLAQSVLAVVALVSALHVQAALAQNDVRERLTAAGIEPIRGTPAQFTAFIQSEMVKWGKVAKDAGVRPE